MFCCRNGTTAVKVKIKKSPKNAVKKLKELSEKFQCDNAVLVGLPKGSNDYPDGTSVILVGLVHEFGSPARGIPERSYLRYTLNQNAREYAETLKKLAKQITNGKRSQQEALGLLGLKLQSDVRQRITDIKDPPLKYREGNPLVDTGHLRQSITYQVGKTK